MAERFEFAERLKALPPYLFAEVDKKKKAAIQAGRDVINLGVGDPDLPTPQPIIEAMNEAMRKPENHRYAFDEGHPGFCKTISEWFQKRFGVALDPKTEILPTIGSKEAIAHFPVAFVNPGDVTLVPDPRYPVYYSGTLFCAGRAVPMPLLPEKGFLPDLDAIDKSVAAQAKLLYLNYPNNPTGAVATLEFFERAVHFARKHNMIILQDAAYTEMAMEDVRPVSILQVPGAKDVSVELHSLSKTFNMTGWRIGFAVGNARGIAGLAKVKTNCDSGVFMAIQEAGAFALKHAWNEVERLNKIYRDRRDALCDGLESTGLKPNRPKATFYVWIPCPKGLKSIECSNLLLEKADIVMTPGVGFGAHGEGYIRAALTVSSERIREAVERIRRLKIAG